MNAILVGNRHLEMEMDSKVRDPRQLETVKKITEDASFDFACCNPFTAEVGGYTGPFDFIYYTKDGVLRVARIGKTGRVLRSIP
jgi:hypothetical protein